MTNWKAFTHNGDVDWKGFYPYTVIAYKLGRRIVLEYDQPHEVKEACQTGFHSAGVIITPNGVSWKREDWLEQYEKCIGLLIDPPVKEISS